VADPIVDRIVRESGVPDLVDVLAERLAQTDLQSLLLEVYRRRAARLAPNDVLAHYERSRLFRPASLDPELDRLARSLLPAGYEFLELSPVAPLGTVAALAGLSQDAALATVRGSEVVSDATNVLALEVALRRRADRAATVRLATSQRMLRTQAPDAPGMLPHFRLFALVAGGRERESALLGEQLDFYTLLLDALGAEHVDVRVTEPGDGSYYTATRFEIRAGGSSIVDGGFVGWTQRLLSDRKERLLISGAGVERLVSLRR
jgi:hypothetical protein